MSVLQYLQLQPVEPNDDGTSDSPLDASYNPAADDITLEERPDEAQLETFWNDVVDDIHKDPDWFTFSD